MSATGDAVQRPAEAGTTLLEMLVVLTITVMIGALMFPGLQRALAGLALAEETSALVANLRIAEAGARLGGGRVDFSVSPDGRGYAWTGAAPRDLPLRATLQVLAPIAFFPDGTASAGALRLDGGGRTRTFLIDPASGAVRAAP